MLEPKTAWSTYLLIYSLKKDLMHQSIRDILKHFEAWQL